MTCRPDVTWIDDKRELKCPPDRRWPDGKDVVAYDARNRSAATCKVDLPFPAKRCGWYLVKCSTCDQQLMVSTAGRRDDPRSLTFECKRKTAALDPTIDQKILEAQAMLVKRGGVEYTNPFGVPVQHDIARGVWPPGPSKEKVLASIRRHLSPMGSAQEADGGM